MPHTHTRDNGLRSENAEYLRTNASVQLTTEAVNAATSAVEAGNELRFDVATAARAAEATGTRISFAPPRVTTSVSGGVPSSLFVHKRVAQQYDRTDRTLGSAAREVPAPHAIHMDTLKEDLHIYNEVGTRGWGVLTALPLQD